MRNVMILGSLATLISAGIASAQPQTCRGGYRNPPCMDGIFRTREPYYAQQSRDGFFSQPLGHDGIIHWNTPHANGGLGNPNGAGGGGSP